METFLHTLRRADEGVTGSFDRAFAPAHNPWRHLGALAFLCLVTAMATGIVAYAWYDTSVQGAYASGLRLQNDPLLLGRLLRDEVARETDALLQCLRYVVRSNFFDDEAAADAAAAAADGGSAASEKEPHAPAEPASE